MLKVVGTMNAQFKYIVENTTDIQCKYCIFLLTSHLRSEIQPTLFSPFKFTL